jgi:hypothetical protein
MLVVDAMHAVLEGLVHYHCRHVLRLDAASSEVNIDSFKIAYDWPWITYVNNADPTAPKLKEKQIPSVARIHRTLSLPLEGDHSVTLEQVWKRLDTQAPLKALSYVVHTLDLSKDISVVDREIKNLFLKRAQEKSTSKEQKTLSFPSGIPTQKSHFIALLLDWVSFAFYTCDVYSNLLLLSD